MVFNSFEFAFFLIPIVFFYWFFLKNSGKSQNIFLLVTSLIFYGWADWRFLILLCTSILINYSLGIKIRSISNEKRQKFFLYLGVIFNVGLLLYFKYVGFFYEGFYKLLASIGLESSHTTLHILVPLGISFFTFQTLGYLIDVYNEEIDPSTDVLTFSVFVAYFPKILSGPIERADDLIPQIEAKREFNYELAADGLRQILWGLFAKIVIAENCATVVNSIYDDPSKHQASTLFVAAVLYAFQIYADFSGYSNMAIGVSKLFGIKLTRNFSTPYFSTNISDFWRKWHMSLTSWMMDYVFTPLSFILRKQEKKGLVISIVTTFILVGFWHGASWTFIVYGLLHGLYFIPLVYSGSINKSEVIAPGKKIPRLKEVLKMLGLFVLIVLTAVFFRAASIDDAFEFFGYLFTTSIIEIPNVIFTSDAKIAFLLVSIFMLVEWLHRERKHDFEISNHKPVIRWLSYIAIFGLMLFFGKSSETFIYFQF